MKHLIVMPFAFPWNWSADYEKETAQQLAKKHIVVAFLVGEGFTLWQFFLQPHKLIESVNDRLYLYRPLYLLPFQRFSVIRNINFRIASLMVRLWIAMSPWKNKRKIYWSFSLQHAVFPSYFGKKYFPLYDCVDACVSENTALQRAWKRDEKKTMAESAVVFVNSSTLFAQKAGQHPHVFQTSEGLFSQEIFQDAYLKEEPDDISVIPKPRITFLGNINTRLDFLLLNKLIQMTPQYSYVFIGMEDVGFAGHATVDFSQEISRLKHMPNCYFLGKKLKNEIPRYIQSSDVGLIPYDISLAFNRYCYPMKISEYFYMGKPVLCTNIEEAKKLVPYISLFHTADEGKRQLQKLVSTPLPRSYIRAMRKIAKSNSIATKCQYVETVLQKQCR